MESIRCVIANMPQQMLVDIVENMAEESGVLEVVERVNSINEIPSVIAKNPVDLLILGVKCSDLPEPFVSVMNSSPNMPILGLVDDGRRLVACLNNVGKNDILKIVTTLGRARGEAV